MFIKKDLSILILVILYLWKEFMNVAILPYELKKERKMTRLRKVNGKVNDLNRISKKV